MAWYPDLAPCEIFGTENNQLIAVGWLGRDNFFTEGEVTESCFEKLCELLRNPWNPSYPAGFHACELCRFSGGNGAVRFREFSISGTSNACLFVPGSGVVYAAPSSIAHYIDAHGYQPPQEFCAALLGCPPMRSTAYFKALLSNGGRELVKGSALTSAPAG